MSKCVSFVKSFITVDKIVGDTYTAAFCAPEFTHVIDRNVGARFVMSDWDKKQT